VNLFFAPPPPSAPHPLPSPPRTFPAACHLQKKKKKQVMMKEKTRASCAPKTLARAHSGASQPDTNSAKSGPQYRLLYKFISPRTFENVCRLSRVPKGLEDRDTEASVRGARHLIAEQSVESRHVSGVCEHEGNGRPKRVLL
jgi:hypothetical protein